jgi:hypothetical protein
VSFSGWRTHKTFGFLKRFQKTAATGTASAAAVQNLAESFRRFSIQAIAYIKPLYAGQRSGGGCPGPA